MKNEWSLSETLMLARVSKWGHFHAMEMWHTTDPAEKGDRRWHSAFLAMLIG
jgi:hypothetical protein